MSRDRMDLLLAEHRFTWDQEEWFAPLAKLLEGVGPAEAAWRPPGGGNTIWQTVNHLNYYNERCLYWIRREAPPPGVANNDATFAPGNREDAAAWEATVAKSREIADKWSALLSELTDADLSSPATHGTIGDLITPVILHVAYHSGQIALLRKMQQSWPASRNG